MQIDRHRYGYGGHTTAREFQRYSMKELLLMQSKGKTHTFTAKEKKQVADYELEQRLKNKNKQKRH